MRTKFARILLMIAALLSPLVLQTFIARPVLATTSNLTQIISGYNAEIRAVDTPGYMTLSGNSLDYSNQYYRNVISAPGTLRDFRVEIGKAPGGVGKTWTFTIYTNGGASGVTLQITNAATSGADTSNTIAVSAGDYVSVYVSDAGTPTTTDVSWSVIFEGSNKTDSNLLGMGSAMGTAKYCPITNGAGQGNAAATDAFGIFPVAGTLKDWYVVTDAPGGAYTSTFLLYINGVQQMSVTVTGAATTGNSLSSVNISAGDQAYIKYSTASGSANYVWWGFTWTSNADLCYIVTGGSSDTPATAATEVMFPTPTVLNAWAASYAYTDLEQDPGYGGAIFSDLYIKLVTAPGAAKSQTINLLQEGLATGLSVTITGAVDTAGVDSVNTWTIPSTNYSISMLLQSVPTNAPTASTIHWGYKVTIPKVPILHTHAATTIKDTYATLELHITLLPNGNADTWGFEWDTDLGAPYANDYHEHGSYATGTYSVTLSRDTLVKNTKYYFRGYSIDSAGTGYGNELNFTTLNPQASSTGVGIVVIGGITASTNYETGLDAFEAENYGAVAIDIMVKGYDATGGTTWTLASAPAANTYSVYAGLDGGSYNVEVKKTAPYNTLKSNLAVSAKQKFGIQIQSPTSMSDSVTKTSKVTVLFIAN